MASIYKVAKTAEVSPATVSRVFSRKARVSESVARRVRTVAEKLNYAPRVTARKDNIALIVEGAEGIRLDNYETQLIEAVCRNLIAQKYRFEIIPADEIDLLFDLFIKGAVCILYREKSLEMARQIQRVPLVMVNCPVENFHSVYSDHCQGIELGMNHLAERGHRRIGLILGSLSGWGGQERLKGYWASVKRLGLENDERLVHSRFARNLFEAVAGVVKAAPTALIVGGEDAALPVMSALHLLGKKVPEDVSIVSFESTVISQYLTPMHTTISQPFEEIGALSVKTIIDLAEHQPRRPVRIAVPNVLIERESVKSIGNSKFM